MLLSAVHLRILNKRPKVTLAPVTLRRGVTLPENNWRTFVAAADTPKKTTRKRKSKAQGVNLAAEAAAAAEVDPLSSVRISKSTLKVLNIMAKIVDVPARHLVDRAVGELVVRWQRDQNMFFGIVDNNDQLATIIRGDDVGIDPTERFRTIE